MRKTLLELEAVDTEGIFRVAADRRECERIKTFMNSDEDWTLFVRDVHCVATLLTTWFRDLPQPIFNAVPIELMEQDHTHSSIADAVGKVQQPEQSLLIWLWDLCVTISENSERNKMNISNLATIMVPSLFDASILQNPLQAMRMLQPLQKFFMAGVEWRKEVINLRQHSKDTQPSAGGDGQTVHKTNSGQNSSSNTGNKETQKWSQQSRLYPGGSSSSYDVGRDLRDTFEQSLKAGIRASEGEKLLSGAVRSEDCCEISSEDSEEFSCPASPLHRPDRPPVPKRMLLEHAVPTEPGSIFQGHVMG